MYWGCRFHDFSFCLFYVRGDWALFSPPPPPLIQYAVNTRVLRFFILFYGGGRGGGCVVVLCTVYCRSQLVCPPPSPFSHYSQLLPFTVGVSPPSHFPLILPIPSFPSSNLYGIDSKVIFCNEGMNGGWGMGGGGSPYFLVTQWGATNAPTYKSTNKSRINYREI